MESPEYWAHLEMPLIYRVRIGARAGFYALSMSLALMVFAFWSEVLFGGLPNALGFLGPAPTIVISFVLLVISIYCAAFPLRAQLKITAETFEWREPTSVRSMQRAEFLGRKTNHAMRSGRAYLCLVSNSGESIVVDDSAFDTDHRFDAWAGSLKQLDTPDISRRKYT